MPCPSSQRKTETPFCPNPHLILHLRNGVNQLLTRHLTPPNNIHTLQNALEPTLTQPLRMRLQLALIQQLLHSSKHLVRKLPNAHVTITSIRFWPRVCSAGDSGCQDPIGLDDFASCAGLGVGVQSSVFAAGAADGGVAELDGRDLRDAVDGVAEGVFGERFDVGGAGGGLVVEAVVGAVGFAEVEVAGGAGGDYFAAATVRVLLISGLFLEYLEMLMGE